MLRRVFPVQRHIFEDKVANVWCALSVLPPFKLRATASAGRALRLSLGALLCALALPAASMLRRPSRRAFELGLVSSALSFFLFSFQVGTRAQPPRAQPAAAAPALRADATVPPGDPPQVHEKHILLPLLPASGLLATEAPLLLGWASALSLFSMFPLLQRDGLGLAYAAHLSLLAALTVAGRALARPDDTPPPSKTGANRLEACLRARARALPPAVAFSALGMGLLHAAAMLIRPPDRYPDLWPYLFCTYACAHFCAAWLALQAWHACHLLGDGDDGSGTAGRDGRGGRHPMLTRGQAAGGSPTGRRRTKHE